MCDPQGTAAPIKATACKSSGLQFPSSVCILALLLTKRPSIWIFAYCVWPFRRDGLECQQNRSRVSHRVWNCANIPSRFYSRRCIHRALLHRKYNRASVARNFAFSTTARRNFISRLMKSRCCRTAEIIRRFCIWDAPCSYADAGNEFEILSASCYICGNIC